jgi:hypothetical protein
MFGKYQSRLNYQREDLSSTQEVGSIRRKKYSRVLYAEQTVKGRVPRETAAEPETYGRVPGW